MDALEFAKEMKRMCESYKHCSDCPLIQENSCDTDGLEKAVPIVEKWSKEHPIVRNVDHVAEGLEKLGYEVDKDILVALKCPPHKALIYSRPSDISKCSVSNCEECKKWWTEEYKEDNADEEKTKD